MSFRELQKKIADEIAKEREEEIKKFLAVKRENNRIAEKKAAQGLKALKEMGIDVAKLEAFHTTMDRDNEAELKEIRAKYQVSPVVLRIEPEIFHENALNAAIAPASVKILPQSYAAIFSTKDPEDKNAGGSGTVVYNYNIIDAWDWARGGGWGCFGSGVGKYNVWAEWGYWFKPESSRYYSIMPHHVFRGYYIVKADDGAFTCKYARALVRIWTNVWQYNWKGWRNWTVLNIGDDNINDNDRFDTNRNVNYSTLLGGGDWAYIRSVVQLYVYARGSGSYSELNFSTGAANYLQAPYVIIY
jgi:hypothetical protein